MPNELGAWLLAVATLLIGGGGIASLIRLFQERDKPKLDNRAVEVATAGNSVGMSIQLATTAMEQVTQFRAEVAELRGRVRDAEQTADAADEKAEHAERRAARAEAAVDAWASWADNVIADWAQLRLREKAPDLPHIARTWTYGKRTDDRNT